jgi:hypothetical protein
LSGFLIFYLGLRKYLPGAPTYSQENLEVIFVADVLVYFSLFWLSGFFTALVEIQSAREITVVVGAAFSLSIVGGVLASLISMCDHAAHFVGISP